MLNPENTLTLHRYWHEFMNNHNVACADQVFADDFVLHDPLSPEPILGRQVFAEMFSELLRAFPDIHYTSEEQISDGDKVVIRWTMHATHQGNFLGIGPTGKAISMSGVDMLHFSSGRIQALRVEANLLGLVHKLQPIPNLQIS